MRGLRKLANWREDGASFRMPVHSTGEPVSAADSPAGEQLLLTICRAGVLSKRAIAAGELETLLSLLGQPSRTSAERPQAGHTVPSIFICSACQRTTLRPRAEPGVRPGNTNALSRARPGDRLRHVACIRRGLVAIAIRSAARLKTI